MSYSVKTTKEGIDYNAVSKVLKSFGMSDCDVDTQKKIFQNSYAVSFLYDDDKLIGCARALSDGFCEAALYNIALAEEYHGQGLGRILIESIIEQVNNAILFCIHIRRQLRCMRNLVLEDKNREWLFIMEMRLSCNVLKK